MTTHTPGPWRYEYETGYCGELIAAHGRCIASFIDEPSKPDANLIAAAPDLLEALGMVRSLLVDIEEYSVDGAIVLVIDAAIAKATGEQP